MERISLDSNLAPFFLTAPCQILFGMTSLHHAMHVPSVKRCGPVLVIFFVSLIMAGGWGKWRSGDFTASWAWRVTKHSFWLGIASFVLFLLCDQYDLECLRLAFCITIVIAGFFFYLAMTFNLIIVFGLLSLLPLPPWILLLWWFVGEEVWEKCKV
jgi:hypothetical protein